MAAPLATEIKQRVAESFVDRLREKTAMARFWRYNAAAKHGVPLDEVEGVSLQGSETVEQPPAQPAIPPAQPLAPVPAQLPSVTQVTPAQETPPLSQSSTALKLLAIAVLAGLGGAAMHGLFADKSSSPQTPAVTTPASNDAAQQTPPYRESPFQYIEDEGGHLP